MIDSAGTLYEAALSKEEIDRILRTCGPSALLVGGQALATWAQYYAIVPVGDLSRTVTMDVDFIGRREIARTLQRSLGKPWQLRTATLDDAGGQVAKVYATVPGAGIKQVDFLSGIVGLDTDAVRRRAVVIELADDTTVHLLHPLDVLESRLRNLDSLPSKRNALGVAQARLAVSVVRAFLEGHLDMGADPRTVRQAVKRIAKLALDTGLCKVAFTYDIDVLAAVPVARIGYLQFHERQWPRVLARLAVKRERFRELQSRAFSARARRAARRVG